LKFKDAPANAIDVLSRANLDLFLETKPFIRRLLWTAGV
jgi:hypothetical protein